MGVFNLEEQLGFYRKYHFDPVNVGIHVVFVPTILWTSFLFGTNLHFKAIAEVLPKEFASYANLGVIASIGYATFYVLLDPTFGIPLFPLLVFSAVEATNITNTYGAAAVKIAAAVHIFSWIVQFIGHGVFEKRAPALLDNLVQALVLAPFFVVFEVAHALGIRKDVIERVDAAIKPEVDKFRAEKARLSKN